MTKVIDGIYKNHASLIPLKASLSRLFSCVTFVTIAHDNCHTQF